MDDSSVWQVFLPDEAATRAAGARLSAALPSGAVVYLQGELGAGKTTLTRGLLMALGHTGRVKSPTYTLVESYPLATCTVHHFDLYRFADPAEWHEAGLSELFDAHSLCLIEWPDKAGTWLPAADVLLALTLEGEGRRLTLTACSPQGHACLTRLISLAVP